jgi:hypothetical protein
LKKFQEKRVLIIDKKETLAIVKSKTWIQLEPTKLDELGQFLFFDVLLNIVKLLIVISLIFWKKRKMDLVIIIW